MDKYAHIRRRIANALNEQSRKQVNVAKKARTAQANISRAISDSGKGFTINTLSKIASGIDMHISALVCPDDTLSEIIQELSRLSQKDLQKIKRTIQKELQKLNR